MKKIILTVASLLSFIIVPAPAFALFNVNQGGTGQAFFTAGSLLYGNGTNPIATTTPGTLGYVLQFNGTFPTWVSTSSLGIISHPAGSNGEIQFNSDGLFGSDSRLKWDTATGILAFSAHPNFGIHIDSTQDAIYFRTTPNNFDTYISDNDGGALYLRGQSSTTAVEISEGGVGGSAEAIMDTHLLTSTARRFTFPDNNGTFRPVRKIGRSPWTCS